MELFSFITSLKKLGLSSRTIAVLCNVSTPTVTTWFAGEHTPSSSTQTAMFENLRANPVVQEVLDYGKREIFK